MKYFDAFAGWQLRGMEGDRMSEDKRYCSQCYWSTNDPDRFPPKWSCSLRRAPINRDEDVCAAWASLKDVLTDKGMERWRKSNDQRA